MAKPNIAKLFVNGRSQAVRLPREFRFTGDSVRIRKVGNGVLLEPMPADTAEWFAAIDASGTGPFMAEGRNQPAAQKRKLF